MSVRCDKAMRRSKEKTRELTEFGVPKWRCSGSCETCICGIIRHPDGTETHVNLIRKGEPHVELHHTAEADHEEKQQSNHHEPHDRQTDDYPEQTVSAI